MQKPSRCIERALAIREQQLGATHPDTATSLNNLAALYQSQGKYAEAEPLYQRALAIREQQLGPSHPDTATSLNNLAVLYTSAGQVCAKPSHCIMRALAIREQQFGATTSQHGDQPEQPGRALPRQGKYARSRAVLSACTGDPRAAVRSLSIPTQLPASTIWQHSTRARASMSEAEPLFKRALAIHEQQLGAQHPDTATQPQQSGCLYTNTGQV